MSHRAPGQQLLSIGEHRAQEADALVEDPDSVPAGAEGVDDPARRKERQGSDDARCHFPSAPTEPLARSHGEREGPLGSFHKPDPEKLVGGKLGELTVDDHAENRQGWSLVGGVRREAPGRDRPEIGIRSGIRRHLDWGHRAQGGRRQWLHRPDQHRSRGVRHRSTQAVLDQEFGEGEPSPRIQYLGPSDEGFTLQRAGPEVLDGEGCRPYLAARRRSGEDGEGEGGIDEGAEIQGADSVL